MNNLRIRRFHRQRSESASQLRDLAANGVFLKYFPGNFRQDASTRSYQDYGVPTQKLPFLQARSIHGE